MTLKIGALFAGYGGLDMAVMDVLDAELAWYAEWDKAPAKVMAHHHPDVPNLWDVTKVDWSAVEPVDIITGGSPCQDLSHAGKRKGMTDGTRSNLWAEMREAIATHRPRLVVWENVRGAGSAEATSAMEQCPRCVGDPRDRGPVLRALGRVVGDLADLGYVGRFYGLRAADVGGAHGRFRYFVCAAPADSAGSGRTALDGERREPRRAGAADATHARHRDAGAGLNLLPTPTADPEAMTHPDVRAARVERSREKHGRPFGDSLTSAIGALFPTPRATDGTKGGPNQRGSSGDLMLPSAVHLLPTPSTQSNEAAQSLDRYGINLGMAIMPEMYAPTFERYNVDPPRWAQYAAAIARAEIVTGRTAPAPTETGPKGKPRLSPAFVEWLMMLPAGHVTDPAIGLTRNEQLKALGNGVVPAQAAAALRAYLADERKAVA